jgi:hypothetical protein
MNFGNTGVFSGAINFGANQLVAMPAALTQPATILSISVFVNTAGAPTINLAIYADNGSNYPGNLVVQSGPASIVDGWNTISITPTYLPTAGTYWLAFLNDSNGYPLVGSAMGPDTYYGVTSGSVQSIYPSSAPAQTYRVALYANYCLGAGIPTYTVTPTFTLPGSPTTTFTPTSTATNTATNTATITGTPGSPTNTPTKTPTYTSTNTTTFTHTNTPTGSPTYTPTITNTLTGSPTPVPTSTWTVTTTNTFTNTPSLSSTNTTTKTPTNTPTRTPTNTPTKTPTNTQTSTQTNTPTSTPSPTVTSTPVGTAIVSTSQTLIAGVAGAVTLSDGSLISVPSNALTQAVFLTVSKYAAGSAPSTQSAPQYQLLSSVYLINSGGVEPQAGASVTITFPYNPADIPAGQTAANLVVTYFDGANWISLPTTVNTTNQTVTVVTNHFSWWAVVVSLNSPTPTPVVQPGNGLKPVLYPNPATSGQVKIQLNLTATSDVKLQVYTTAYRKVRDVTIPTVAAGTDVNLDLVDKANATLADGLYYVVLTTNQGKSILKLLIMR